MPRILDTAELIPVIAALAKKACCELGDDVIAALRDAQNKEESPYGRDCLRQLVENAEYAKKEQIACCQDTGTCNIILEIGQEVSWKGMPLSDAVNEGVSRGYEEGFLRKSIVKDPFDRINTGDNTPAMLHTEIVAGDRVSVTVMPKGGGCENMGAFCTLLPSDGVQGVIQFVIQTVDKAGGKPCPPLLVGVGIGGSMDKCVWLAKKALLRPVGSRSSNPFYSSMETELLEKINNLGIGPMGTGGRITALDAHIEYSPCHITALPVAVNLQCHASRVARAEI
jgi:fumarate hydratase subunit alpha